jgi:hypothetical protein
MKLIKMIKVIGTSLAVIIGSVEPTPAFVSPNQPPTTSFDKRRDALPDVQLPAQRQRAVTELQARLPGAHIDYDPVTGSPAWVSTIGLLSQTPDEETQRIGRLGLASDDPHRAIKAFLIENAAVFGHGPEALTNATITREFVTAHNGMRTVVWQQELDGIPVFEGVLIGHITKRGELVNILSHFLTDIEKVAGLDVTDRSRLEFAPPISATQAVANALTDLGEKITVDVITPVSAASPKPEKLQMFTAAPLFGEARANLV